MWSKLPKRLVANMLASHLSIGLFAGALLYILCVSGTAMVFHQEFERWEQPKVAEFEQVSPQAVQQAALAGLAQGQAEPHEINIGLPVSGMPRLTVVNGEQAWFADQQGKLITETDNDWAHFLEKLHYYLTLPWVLGLTVVGILGVLMTGLCLSGTLAHPRLFRDAFRFRRGSGARLGQADLHNRLSVWGLPFHLTIAITGAGIGVSMLVAATLAPVVNEGRTDTFFAPIFGAETEGEETPAPLSDIASALTQFEQAHPDLTPWWVSVHHPATVGQDNLILAQHPRRLIFGDYHGFANDGTLTDNTGLSDGAIGQQVVASLYPLHFGSFGGLAIKLAYGLLGIASSIVVASGLNIWLLKRRQTGRAAPRIERAWVACVWGLPAILAAVMLLDLMFSPGMITLVSMFWLSLASLTLAAATGIRACCDRASLQKATAAILVATVALHLIWYGVYGGAAAGVSLALLITAAAFFTLSRQAPLVPGVSVQNQVPSV